MFINMVMVPPWQYGVVFWSLSVICHLSFCNLWHCPPFSIWHLWHVSQFWQKLQKSSKKKEKGSLTWMRPTIFKNYKIKEKEEFGPCNLTQPQAQNVRKIPSLVFLIVDIKHYNQHLRFLPLTTQQQPSLVMLTMSISGSDYHLQQTWLLYSFSASIHFSAFNLFVFLCFTHSIILLYSVF